MAKQPKTTQKDDTKKESAPKDAKGEKEAQNYDQYWSDK